MMISIYGGQRKASLATSLLAQHTLLALAPSALSDSLVMVLVQSEAPGVNRERWIAACRCSPPLPGEGMALTNRTYNGYNGEAHVATG